MSELFDQDPRAAAPPPRSARSRALIITAVVLVLAFFGLTTFASVYTDRLWFNDLGYGEVFSTLLWTRIVLFVVFGVLMAAAVGVSMYVAFRTRPLFHPNSPEQTGLDRYREAVTPIRTWLLVGTVVVLGVFAGTSAVGQWRSYLLWRNGTDFDTKDPYFNRDVGFYVFDLPWLHYLVDFVMVLAVVALLASVVVHYLYGGIRLQSPGDRLSGAAQVQLSVLLGIFVLAKGGDYWLDRFDLTSDSGGLLTGMGYTDENAVLPAKNIMIGIAVICAVLLFLNVWRRTWMLPSVGIALLALSAVLLGMIWPALVQQFQVKPTEADKEESYIAANIEATRAAFDIDDDNVDITAVPDQQSQGEQLAAEIAETPVRLVDPNVVPAAFEQAQQIRGYYSVADVLDVDRYDVDGTPRDVVIGVRELNQAGINQSSQNWANLHTVYTHGDGVIAAYGNQRGRDNQEITTNQEQDPQWADPTRGDLTAVVGEFESRIYFGENSPEYSIVGKKSDESPDLELDVPIGVAEGSEPTSTYDGETGIGVGNLFRKVMYGIKFGEPNLVLSDRVHENSRILYDRDPAEMVEKVAPWLTVDADPVPAVVDGKIVWIIDGYTTTDRYPQSQKESFEEMTDTSIQDETAFQTLPTDEINYIRNAVKATVDAYDGTVTLYAWDEEDPMLKAWRGAFPDTVKDRSEISPELMEHLRYPEDLFKAQRYQLARYHVTDAGDWYQDNERWEVPTDPNSETSLQPPYRLTIGNVDGGTDFAMTSTFVPYNRQNLASFMSVVADATSENYGRIQVLDVSQGAQVAGPGQVAASIAADTELQDALVPFTRGGEARPVRGNLLTIPVGGRLLYVQPVYTIRETGSGRFPVFQYVAVAFDDNVGFGRNLSQAAADLLGVDLGTGTGGGGSTGGGGGEDDPSTEPEGTVEEQIRSLLTRADRKFTEAEAALAEGRLGDYQTAVEEAQDLVGRALQLDEQRATGDEPAPDEEETPPAE
ncbi:MAG TPA: UPF0182 family protein [Nocardioides sp.]|uniref:UPF0182 family membrane protein n=1 Tax=Nocardioides sp. TaxID=35761 RepID=UPI002CC31D0D|nr:UPF0182 family protein [Nocardioides sp.]HTW15094.1 UPF0182 family protein [Nocardioides sp.]